MTDTQRDRAIMVLKQDGVDKKIYLEKTGFADHLWHAFTGRGKSTRAPTADELETIFTAFDMSPLWVFQGRGPMHTSELLELIDSRSADRREGSAKTHHRMVSEENSAMLKKVLAILKP